MTGYRPEPGIYDEMLLPNGELRAHWKTFGSFLNQCTKSDFSVRADSIQRLLRDHGVTYNIYDDALGTSRPWSLDTLPFILALEEFQQVQRGLDQRGRLLNAILSDLYGPQKLLRDGLLPPSLVYANPGYLRPVRGIIPAGGRFVFTMGSDLVRGADGHWRVLADRAQAPSGHGYALENRIILANVYAEEFNASKVKRLAAYFEMKRDMLRSLAPKRRSGDAGILMLTPGPYNETYFEHAFKARYLGFPLVEGADLTVRDRHLHLKTLEGLRRVDVMVRHVDDVFCDPLELNSGSLLGAPGLLEAWRNGSIAMANGLGAGLVETPALHPFMPGLCRHLLGEELLLPCVPTWWCGQKRELDLVLSQPDRWVVKPAFVRGARDPVFLADLDAEQKARMLDTIRATPHEWVAQEVLSLSTTPTWTGSKIEPRSLVWRAFIIAQGDGFIA
ncbi:MAG: circularly permuted type 2 ATP-grasp protein, partial [Prosthecobacter sp.]